MPTGAEWQFCAPAWTPRSANRTIQNVGVRQGRHLAGAASPAAPGQAAGHSVLGGDGTMRSNLLLVRSGSHGSQLGGHNPDRERTSSRAALQSLAAGVVEDRPGDALGPSRGAVGCASRPGDSPSGHTVSFSC